MPAKNRGHVQHQCLHQNWVVEQLIDCWRSLQQADEHRRRHQERARWLPAVARQAGLVGFIESALWREHRPSPD